MVRKKEVNQSKPAQSARNIKISRPKAEPKPVKTVVAEEEMNEERPLERPVKKLGRQRRGGRGVQVFWAVVLVAALLALGWFGTKFVLGSEGNPLAGLFNLGGAKLVGEEENHVNILLFGNPGDPAHDGPNLTDTLMLASYNPEAKFLHLFSIPRDLWITIPGYGGSRINTVYSMGENEDNNGAGLLTDTMSELLGVEIPYYMRIDFQGFKQIVDELGGVQVTVSKDLYDPFYPTPNKGYETLDIKAGNYTMGGEMALKYARSRETTSDFDRARRQQEVILALRQKAMDLDILTAPSKMFAITDILADHFSTNLSKEELTRLMKLLADFDSGMVAHKVFDNTADGLLYATREGEASVLKPVDDDYSKLSDFVAEALGDPTASSGSEEPADEPTAEPLRVEVMNGTNVTGLAGRVAEKLEEAGMTIVRVANNPTRGFTESMVYDNTSGDKASAIGRLMGLTGAKLNSEKLTLPTTVDVRLVVGADAETKFPQ